MKPYHIAHAAVTLLLFTTTMMFVALLFTGVIEVRGRSAQAKLEPVQPARVGGVKARLLVVRGLLPNSGYQIFEGRNVIGRAAQQPVDIDLELQEPQDRIWSSRQHAAITCEGGNLAIEDLSSTNGTYVNGRILPPGQKQSLKAGDIIQIGAVQLKMLE